MLHKDEEYFKQLDGLRCISVVMVMIDHWVGELPGLPLGFLGVTIFFVLSGFLITNILIKSKLKNEIAGLSHWKSLYSFVARRSLRIFPAYFFCVALLVLFNVPPVREKLIWYLAYATNFYIAKHQIWLGSSDHFWSLAVEEQFYLFFPWLIFFVPKRHFVTLFSILIFGSILLRVLLQLKGGYAWVVSYVLTPACFDSLVAGSLLAYIFNFDKKLFNKIPQKTWLWVVLGFILTIIGTIKELSIAQTIRPNWTFDVWQRSIFSLFGFVLIARTIKGWSGVGAKLLENSFVQYLGKISYGLYIYHNFIFNHYHTPEGHITRRILKKISDISPALSHSVIFQFVLFFSMLVVIASASWYIIEKPLNNLKRHFTY
jgi:peptidoglycan/LPS O-acetylase OafA/YrhL